MKNSLIALAALLCGLCSPVQASDAGQPGDWEAVDKLFTLNTGTDKPAAAVAITWQGELVYKQTYGMANIEKAIPADDNTAFNLASLTKQFVAYAILQLAENGRLDLDDPVTKFIPELDYDSVTLRHLMVQTSGIAAANSTRFGAFGSGRTELLIELYSHLELANEPGTVWAYNNNNYDLLSIVVERASGKRLQDYLASEVFAPLGMTRSFFPYGQGANRDNRAFGYRSNGDTFRNVDTRDVQQSLVGGGGLYSSLNDLLLWSHAFHRDSQGKKTRQMEGLYNSGSPVSYGAGLNVTPFGKGNAFEHGGTSGATSTYTAYFPEWGASIIVLIASDQYHSHGGAEQVVRQIRDLVMARFDAFAEGQVASPEVIPVTARMQKLLPGKWWGEVNGRLQVVEVSVTENDKVKLAFFDGFKAELSAVSPVRLIADGMPDISVSVSEGALTLWNARKTMGKLSKLIGTGAADFTSAPIGHFTAASLNHAIWTIRRDKNGLSATSPRGAVYPLTPITNDIIGNIKSNVYFRLATDADNMKHWILIGGQMAPIKLAATSKQPALPILSETLAMGDMENAESCFKELMHDAKRYVFDEGGLNRLGYHYLQNGSNKQAIAAFKWMVELFPGSINALDSLGEAYEADGQSQQAKAIWRKILELDPVLVSYRDKIDDK